MPEELMHEVWDPADVYVEILGSPSYHNRAICLINDHSDPCVHCAVNTILNKGATWKAIMDHPVNEKRWVNAAWE